MYDTSGDGGTSDGTSEPEDARDSNTISSQFSYLYESGIGYGPDSNEEEDDTLTDMTTDLFSSDSNTSNTTIMQTDSDSNLSQTSGRADLPGPPMERQATRFLDNINLYKYTFY